MNTNAEPEEIEDVCRVPTIAVDEASLLRKHAETEIQELSRSLQLNVPSIPFGSGLGDAMFCSVPTLPSAM
jgi:hypothetical protein